MYSSYLVFVLFAIEVLLARAVSLPQGRAAWVYDPPHLPGTWVSNITQYNTASDTLYPLNVLFSYGGDMELDYSQSPPYVTYFPDYYQQSAQLYSQLPGVDTVICIIDGASSVLNTLSTAEIKEWADITAALYCAVDVVAGLQIDLEPFSGQAVLLNYLTYLQQDLTSTQFGCVNAQYPEGRFLSFFLSANHLSTAVYEALGPLGFAIISGYDLSAYDAGVPSTPTYYGTNLQATIQNAITNGAGKGSFFLGLPAAASFHEFQQFLPGGLLADLVSGYPMWSSSGGDSSYMTVAETEIQNAGLSQSPYFLGPALYTYTTYKSTADTYYPCNPFQEAGEEQWLRVTNLGDTTSISSPTILPTGSPTDSPTASPTVSPTDAPSNPLPTESSESGIPANQGGVVVCVGPVYENQVFTLVCPNADDVITAVEFASYGTPTGSCGTFQASSCDLGFAITLFENACLNQKNCTFTVSNAFFQKDPCPYVRKHFDAEVTCANPSTSNTNPKVSSAPSISACLSALPFFLALFAMYMC